jgi:hypothetical protein
MRNGLMLAEHLQKLEEEQTGNREPILVNWRTLGFYMEILARQC